MKKAKVVLSLMLSAVMVGGLLTGCGSSAAPVEENAAEAPQTEEAEAAEQLAVPEERSISGTYQTVDRRTVRGQKIPYESGWRPVARRKKLHG